METIYQNASVIELLQLLNLESTHQNAVTDLLHKGDVRYARDLKINLKNVIASEYFTEKEVALLALAITVNQKNNPLIHYFSALAGSKEATPEEIVETAACASLLASNNVLYRFRHFTHKEKYEQIPARIKMNIMMNPLLGKDFFELISLAVSAVNGCERCVNAHENSLVQMGIREEKIFESIRIASVIMSLDKVIY